MSFFKDIQHTFLFRTAILIFGFCASVIMARMLGSSGVGVFTIVTLVPAMTASTISLGLDTANTYLIGKSKYLVKEVTSSCVSISIILTIAGIAVAILLAACFGLVPKNVQRLYIYVAALIIPFDIINRLFSGIILGLNRIRKINVIRFWANVSLLASLVVLLIVLKTGIIGAILAGIVAMVVNAAMVFIKIPEKRSIRLRINYKWLKEAAVYGVKERTGATLDNLVARADVFFVAYYAGLAPLGWYAISYKLFSTLIRIPMSIFYVLFPKVSISNAKEANKVIPIVCRNTIFIVAVITIAALIIIKPFILGFYGSKFANSIYPALILLPGAVFLSIVYIMQAYFNGMGQPQYYIYLSGAMLIVNVILNIILIPRWGILGAAVATIISYFVGAVFSLSLYLKLSGNSLWDSLVLTRDDWSNYLIYVKNLAAKLRPTESNSKSPA